MSFQAFGIHGVCATTMGATPAVIVNGPERHTAGVNFKVSPFCAGCLAHALFVFQHGVLGSGSRANACIGRAVKLVLQNIGGARLGTIESTTLGNACKFTMCLAEWEVRVNDEERKKERKKEEEKASSVSRG